MIDFLLKIRQFFYKRFLRKQLANKSKSKTSKKINLESAKRIGILFDATDLKTRKTILDYVETLKNRRKVVKLLGYFDNKLKDNNFTFRHYNKKNINWALLPKGDQVDDFINQPYDVMINLNTKSTKDGEYITALTNAPLKVGPVTENTACYDLMLDSGKNIEINQFIKQVESILKKTTTT